MNTAIYLILHSDKLHWFPDVDFEIKYTTTYFIPTSLKDIQLYLTQRCFYSKDINVAFQAKKAIECQAGKKYFVILQI